MRGLGNDQATEGKDAELRVVARVAPYLWPKDAPWVKRRVVLALLALILAKFVSVGAPYLYKMAVDDLAGQADGTTLLAIGAVGLTIAYGLSRLMTIAFQQLRDVIFARVAQHSLRGIGLETFRHIHALSLRYHISRKTGGLSRVMERGVKGVAFLLRFLLFSIGPLVLELALICVMFVLFFDLRYLAVIGVAVVAYVWFTAVVTEWRVKIRKEMNAKDTDANQKAIDSLLNFETVKYFGAEGFEARRYDGAMAGYEDAALRTSYSLGFINFGQALIINAALVVVMLMAALDLMAGRGTVGDFVLVNAYMMQIMMPLNMLGFVYREIRQALVDMSEMFSLLETPAEVRDRPSAPDIVVDGGRISFENLSFGYDDDRPILKDVSFTIGAGETVAIVGASGSGKSTLGRLLFRFYDVGSGRITIDGQDIRDVTQESLHRVIGVVPQDTVLFNDTIAYNIGYGREGADMEAVKAAANAAQIHDFVASLPKGYDTTVGERGLKLSGGEKQRVGIARTLLKDPPILILDEATSALDTETEHEIQERLTAMGQGRSVLTIAHRLSTVVDADRIIVLEAGQVVEEGSHETLLSRDGRYAKLWHMQVADQEGA